jgi:hypothetical protein
VGIGVLRATPAPQAPADPLAARLASVDTTTLTVRRAAFCAALGDAAASAALGAPATSRASWKPGDRIEVSARTKDVGDEYGCSWSSASGSTARAWIFAPPVTPDRAKQLAASKPASTCAPLRRMPAFGSPTSALTCGDDTVVRGLFGDAWVSCALTSHDRDLVGRWCLAVARAAG